MSPFDAICHAYTTVSTAGFSSHDVSMGYYDSSSIEFIATVFMLLGSIHFALHFLVWRRRNVNIYRGDSEVLVFLGVTLIAALLTLAAGLDIESAICAVVASITLLGPGLGEVATSFADVNAIVKWLALAGMLVGRLEVFPLLLLFTFTF